MSERIENKIEELEVRKKVIEGLEWCMCKKHDCYIEKGCPYENEAEGIIGCKYALHRDALALLKAQGPRVMTATEAYTADCVYIEFGGVITPAIRTSNERNGHRESYFATQQLGGDWMRWDDYGITWRCWTSRPTDEQRKTVPWNRRGENDESKI